MIVYNFPFLRKVIVESKIQRMTICIFSIIKVKTNFRCIFKNPKLFGLKADIVDINYRDISNVRLKKGMFSSEIYY